MRIAIGSDHAGFELKEAVKAFLAQEHHDVLDVDAFTSSVERPNSAEAEMNVLVLGRRRYRSRALGSLDSRLRALPQLGQSVWLDYIRRSSLTSGELANLVAEDGLCGVTSNPAIFEKAVTGSSDYREFLRAPEARSLDPKEAYERLAVRDVQDAADILRPVYDATRTRDGYVSLEVSPFLAHDVAGTLAEARHLWRAVDRPNLMIKVPATKAGIGALRELVAEGINVNATLLFSVAAYEEVAEAYMSGLERLVARGREPGSVASVASFFVSRIDTAVDALLEDMLQTEPNAREPTLLRGLQGKIAIANAKVAYQRYREIVGSPRWQSLAARGAQPQRLLWASTGVKNPRYSDVLYVEELIGPETVNTMPPATLAAFRDHGRPRVSLTEDLDAATETLRLLADTGISLKQVTDRLLFEGLQLFAEAFAKLLAAIDAQTRAEETGRIDGFEYHLPPALTAAVERSLGDWSARGKVRLLWDRDASLWTGKDESQWLGWLGITNGQLAHVQRFARITEVARNSGFKDALLLGMGGSSLGPEVLRATFGTVAGFPVLHVLDSTDPEQVKEVEQRVDLANTLVIVSSKSGSTLEPNILKDYFFDRVRQLVGAAEAGRRFVAITDPGSNMQQVAERDGFRHVFFGRPDIGGRYSALSDFGLVPAAIMGVDVAKFLDRTDTMVCACMPSAPVDENPGVVLGTILGVAARDFSRDKLTIVASPGLARLGAWLEQLVAESTGKNGRGIIPVDREGFARADTYGSDRLFVYLRLTNDADAEQDSFITGLEWVGQPVVRIAVDDVYDVGGEMFRWQVATAVAGAILGVHPFDQPDVEASKAATRKLTEAYERSRELPAETPLFSGAHASLYTDEKNAAALKSVLRGKPTLAAYLHAHLSRIGAGDYFALLAYVAMNEPHETLLQRIRERVRDAKRVATCLQFGPRFLHSTGQGYKGGPSSGVFLQITCDDAVDLPVPGRNYTFGIVKAAQARGDLDVLLERGRRALRVHLHGDVAAGFAELDEAIAAALR